MFRIIKAYRSIRGIDEKEKTNTEKKEIIISSIKEYDRINASQLLENFQNMKNAFFEGSEVICIDEETELEVYIKRNKNIENIERQINIAETLIQNLTQLDNLTQDRLEEISQLYVHENPEWQCDLTYIDIDDIEPKLVYCSRYIATEWVTIMTFKDGKWQIKNF